MHPLHPRRILAAALMVVAIVAATMTLRVSAQTSGRPERYNATAINMGTGPGAMGRVLISIERWSTVQERDRLLSVFLAKGPDKLLDALQANQKVGFIRLPNTLAWDLRYALESPLPDGGRRVVLATDRPITFNEARTSPRQADYPFTLLDIRFDKDGKGVGKMSLYTKIALTKDKQSIELENYGREPVRLTEVRIEK
jgi:hypothetical protein